MLLDDSIMSGNDDFISDPMDADLLFDHGGLGFSSFLQDFPLNEQDVNGIGFSKAEMAGTCMPSQDVGSFDSGLHFQQAMGMVGMEGSGPDGNHGFGDPLVGRHDEMAFGQELQISV